MEKRPKQDTCELSYHCRYFFRNYFFLPDFFRTTSIQVGPRFEVRVYLVGFMAFYAESIPSRAHAAYTKFHAAVDVAKNSLGLLVLLVRVLVRWLIVSQFLQEFCPPFQLATPPENPSNIPKGRLVSYLFLYMARSGGWHRGFLSCLYLVLFYKNFPHPLYYLRAFPFPFSLSSYNSDRSGGHQAGSSPPFPATVCAFFYQQEELNPLLPRRLASKCVYHPRC